MTKRTLGALADRFLREQRIRTKPTSHAEESRLWRVSILPELGADLELGDLEPDRVRAWHLDLSETPYLANRALNSLAHALAEATAWGWLPEGKNPCRGIRRFPERARTRSLEGEELVRLGDALATLTAGRSITETSGDAIRALAYTGCRRNEILRLAWRPNVPGGLGWVDFEAGALRFSDSKGGPKVVPLNAVALDLFRRRSHARELSPWVFPGRVPGEPLAGLQRAWERACELAGIDGACLHTLRHSFATALLDAGNDLKLVASLLGQRDLRTTAKYQHPSMSTLRRATESVVGIFAPAGA